MSTSSTAFPPDIADAERQRDETTATILRRTARRLRAIDQDRPWDRYEAVHHAATTLLPVDALVVGLFRDDLMVVPYAEQNGVLEAPDVLHLRAGTAARWVRDTERTYRFSDDDGRMLCDSVSFGEGSEPSRDAVLAPIRDRDDAVRGLLGVHSLAENAFDTGHVRTVEALAYLLGRVADDPGTGLEDEALHAQFPELVSSTGDSIDQLHEAASLMDSVRRGVLALPSAVPEDARDEVTARVEALSRLCEEASMHLAQMAATAPLPGSDAAQAPDPGLTPREKEIALLIVTENLTNVEIAERLFISVKTVKTHVGAILRKCGQTQRSGLALVVPGGADGSRGGSRSTTG